MKNAASCEKWCELQDTLNTDFSNAHCGLGSYPGPRLSEGRIRLTQETPSPVGRTGLTLRRLKFDSIGILTGRRGVAVAHARRREKTTNFLRLDGPRLDAKDDRWWGLRWSTAVLHAYYYVDLRSDEMTR